MGRSKKKLGVLEGAGTSLMRRASQANEKSSRGKKKANLRESTAHLEELKVQVQYNWSVESQAGSGDRQGSEQKALAAELRNHMLYPEGFGNH